MNLDIVVVDHIHTDALVIIFIIVIVNINARHLSAQVIHEVHILLIFPITVFFVAVTIFVHLLSLLFFQLLKTVE